MNEVFLPVAAFTMKRPLTNSMDPGRYESETAALHGVVAEMYETLPDNFHDELETSIAFRTLVSKFLIKLPTFNHLFPVAYQFLSHFNANRRNIIHKFRSGTASEIFGHLTQYYRVSYKREDLPEFRALLKFSTDDSDDAYSKYPPLFFPDKRSKDMRKLFRCVELTKVCFGYLGFIRLLIFYFLDA